MSDPEPLGNLRRFLGNEDEPEPGPDARLGEIAVARGYCTEAQLEAALEEQAAALPRILIGELLVRRKSLSSAQLLRLLAFQRRPGADARPPLPKGVSIGRYALVEELGRGDRSVVYRGVDPDGLSVAVKVLKPGAADTIEATRLLRAAERAAALRTPGVLQIRETGMTAPASGPARPYLVMDVVTAPTLEHLLAEGASSRGALLQILEEAARVLAAAAAAGMTHGGIKASNIFVGRTDRILVADFGLARSPHPPSDVDPSALRRLGGLAPEQVECRAWHLERADVFALGALLYEILCGRPPFQGESAPGLFQAIAAAAPPPLRRWSPTVEPAIEALCRRAMERDPDHRFPGAAALADELARFRGGLPLNSVPAARFKP